MPRLTFLLVGLVAIGCESIPDLRFDNGTDAAPEGGGGPTGVGDTGSDAVTPDTGGGPTGFGDTGSDAVTPDTGGGPTCVLPSGATMCCGAVACTNHDGSCTAPNACTLCSASCTKPNKPVCCANGGTVACVATPGDC